MKLRNKKTGEIGTPECSLGLFNVQIIREDTTTNFAYNSLAELNEEWEDYEEPKEQWYIGCDGEVYEPVRLNQFDLDRMANIGNYFETKEEAEKAVEKLKAWKRLKDKGFKFDGYGKDIIDFKLDEEYSEYTYNGYDEGIEMFLDSDVEHDLDLLFGGKE